MNALDDIDVRMSFRNGCQITIDVDADEAYHYVAVGVTDTLEVVHGSCSDEDITDDMEDTARNSGRRPREYWAAHYDMIEKLLEVPL